ncbi:MAG: tRNA pseudouridine(38-40) synthase TruA [Gammaproteobacteria bacterium]|nr:MAG: tRNA pseudouridine(38-40) synthase TruA [Gammaproteobacteria bacterium]
MRIAMGVEYSGSDFCGWQLQVGVRTVQEEIEKAISYVANHGVRVICAGRTDTGVHAYGQVIHFDTDAQRDKSSWLMGCNANLPGDVSVNWVSIVDTGFHARFSASRRRYRYVIFNRNVRPSVLANLVAWEYRALDEARMFEASRCLLGEHDFSSYRTVHCQAKSPVRTVHQLDIYRHGEYVVIDIEANAFLHHMVRNIAGVLMAIGAGDQDISWASEVLACRDRLLGGVTASPRGLYLINVIYPDEFSIPGMEYMPFPG